MKIQILRAPARDRYILRINGEDGPLTYSAGEIDEALSAFTGLEIVYDARAEIAETTCGRVR